MGILLTIFASIVNRVFVSMFRLVYSAAESFAYRKIIMIIAIVLIE